MTYRNIRRAEQRTALDRETWAGVTLAQVSYDVTGQGQTITEEIDFGTVFESVPFFTYGVELIEGSLVDGDFPFVGAGVAEWVTDLTSEEQDAGPTRTVHYLGAKVWINVASSNQYELRFRLSFEGVTPRNVRVFRGG